MTTAPQLQKYGYAEASEVTGLRKETLYALVLNQRIPHYRIGPRTIVFEHTELLEWMTERRVNAVKGPRRRKLVWTCDGLEDQE
jgi:excisionase family DNA binding protein